MDYALDTARSLTGHGGGRVAGYGNRNTPSTSICTTLIEMRARAKQLADSDTDRSRCCGG